MYIKENNHLLIESKGGVLRLLLNRPERLNAFSPQMISGLKEAMKEAKSNERVRVIVISGAGNSFSSGGDVSGMGEGTREATTITTYEHLANLNGLIKSMREIEKPIIAAVHGYAAGAGFSLALAADIILAAEESKYVQSFSKIGLVSDGGSSYFLPRLIGSYRAKELFFKAEPITVMEAESMGIVNHVYPINEFREKVDEFVENLASGPSKAYGFLKKLTNQSLTSSLDEMLEHELISQAIMVTTEDHYEGVLAFKEKRKPNFKGK